MRIKVSFPDWELSIEIEGEDEIVASLFDFGLKTLLKVREIITGIILEKRKSFDTLK